MHYNEDATTFDELKNYNKKKSSSTTAWTLIKTHLDDNIITKIETQGTVYLRKIIFMPSESRVDRQSH